MSTVILILSSASSSLQDTLKNIANKISKILLAASRLSTSKTSSVAKL
ncbi:MAG: hypothetical protein ACTS8R_02240 [Arsenophonus sp. NC-QC1-MAG3]